MSELSSFRGHRAELKDKYFLRARSIIERFGDCEVTYAIFLRRPVLAALRPARQWLEKTLLARGGSIRIIEPFTEGARVGAGEPLLFIQGQFSQLVELETQLLQKIGPTCVAAWQAEAISSSGVISGPRKTRILPLRTLVAQIEKSGPCAAQTLS